MIITPDTDDSLYKIKSYTPGALKINEETYTAPVVISAEKLLTDWQVNTEQPCVEDFYFLDDFKPEVFILGTGATLRFPSRDVLQLFSHLHIGIECMTTAAACRTFSVLVSERRNVAAGLFT